MNDNTRFVLISRIASAAYRGDCDMNEALWIIGMLSDITLSHEEVAIELERIKQEVSDLTKILSGN